MVREKNRVASAKPPNTRLEFENPLEDLAGLGTLVFLEELSRQGEQLANLSSNLTICRVSSGPDCPLLVHVVAHESTINTDFATLKQRDWH